jgi:polyferredoxin|tara:strand:- start:720 stop:893 length:174 start_codon:yes stop_codon:yes gene_type:complete
MDKALKIIFGLLILLAGLYSYIQWPSNLIALWTIIRGSVGLVVILVGLLLILMGLTE